MSRTRVRGQQHVFARVLSVIPWLVLVAFTIARAAAAVRERGGGAQQYGRVEALRQLESAAHEDAALFGGGR
ncbi:MAG TPA: hypothetical protein VFZ04_22865, partial [Longimicrobiales bacterium]